MSAFHYRARLRAREGSAATYAFTPDDMMPDLEFGAFRVDGGSWNFEILSDPMLRGKPFDSGEKCIPALIHKIKKYHAESRDFPDEVLFVA
jgi:hypothetical protein